MTEVEKYQGIYSSPSFSRYGRSNHGEKAMPFLLQDGWKTLLDVGCGHNDFVQAWRAAGRSGVGVDFACPSADHVCDAKSLPFGSKSFEVVTAFDMLEHLLESEVDAVLAEFARVAERFCFSICHRPSHIKWKGENLHPTVRPPEWWVQRMLRAGAHRLVFRDGYWYGCWGNPVWKPEPSTKVMLVGNGPGMLGRNLGRVIDSFDLVVRFNAYHLRGYEQHIGTRTDVWSTFGKGVVPADQDQRPSVMSYMHGELGEPSYAPDQIWRLPMAWFHQVNARAHAASLWPAEKKARLMGSSGLNQCLWLLDVAGVEQVVLVGFDHFLIGEHSPHHYWQTKNVKKPNQHDGEAEKAVLSPYASEGRVVYL